MISIMTNRNINADKVKELFDLAQKSPAIIKFDNVMSEIKSGIRSSISQRIIDDAFDAFGIIVKNISQDPKEVVELHKIATKLVLCEILTANNIAITND